jgi:hypothetical protein
MYFAGPVQAADSERTTPCKTAARTLKDHWNTFDVAAQGGKVDGIVSKDDMRRIARIGGEKDKQAAKYFINHKAVFKHLDTAAEHDDPDTKVSKADLAVFMNYWPAECR